MKKILPLLLGIAFFTVNKPQQTLARKSAVSKLRIEIQDELSQLYDRIERGEKKIAKKLRAINTNSVLDYAQKIVIGATVISFWICVTLLIIQIVGKKTVITSNKLFP